MLEKPLSYWMALAAVGLWLVSRENPGEGLFRRICKTFASGLLAVGVSHDVAVWAGVSDSVAAVVIMAFGLLVLDLVTALIADRAFIKEIVAGRFNRGPRL